MKFKSLLTILFVSFSFAGYPQENISEARKRSIGSTVTVKGIATNGPELGAIRYVQDQTAGIAAYDASKVADIKRGDSITITGKLKSYNNLLEISPISSVTIHSSGHKLPTPRVVTPNQLGENYEGQLVRINNASFTTPEATFQGNTSYTFSSNGEFGDIYVSDSYTSLVGEVIPQDEFDLVCICSQFSYSENNTTSGYQVIPRDMSDFIIKKSITLTAPLKVEDIRKTALNFSWETNTHGSTQVAYGNSPNMQDWHGMASGSSTPQGEGYLHSATISNLASGSLVYARAFSVNPPDTAFSPVRVFATQSNSSGEIKVYFNTDVKEELSRGTIAQELNEALDDTIIAYINRAKHTIDVCIYNINNSGISNISQALNNAYNRGVRIRVITCGTTNHFGIFDLDAGIPVFVGPVENERSGIMHNKFIIFDAHSSNYNEPVVCMGSTNFTSGQINHDPNNILFIQDQSLALGYELEFEEMWGSSGSQFDVPNAKFGNKKADNTPHQYIIGNKKVESYFSPTDGTNQQIINQINKAGKSLNIATMLITRNDLAYSIRDAKDNNGASVNMLTDSKNRNSTTVNDILQNALGGQYIYHNTLTGMMHNKYAIINESDPASSPVVITGSHNWSNAANNDNDENTLIIHDAGIANQFYQQFAYLFTGNNGVLENPGTPPNAINDTISTLQEGSIEIPVLLNDMIEGEVELMIAEDAKNGHSSITQTNPKTITYEPGQGFSGHDSIEYKISYISNPVLNSTAKILVDVWATSLNSYNEKQLKLFPNPVSKDITFISNALFNSLEIIDLSGRVLIQENCLSSKFKTLGVEKFKSGFYVVRVTFRDGGRLSKVIIKK